MTDELIYKDCEVQPLFEYPVAIELSDDSQELTEGLLHTNGRFFARVIIPLPLDNPFPIIEIGSWMEIERPLAAEMMSNIESGHSADLTLVGQLATDIPGYPGALGASLIAEANQEGRTVALDVVDTRLPRGQQSKEKMYELYRYVWGNDMPLVSANDVRRNTVRDHIGRIFGRDAHCIQVQPPPPMAGLEYPEVQLLPPLDTGEEAVMVTVGCSDVESELGEAFEIMAALRNPSDDLVNEFGMFTMISRLGQEALHPGAMILRHDADSPQSISGSDGMNVWYLSEPLSLPEELATIQSGSEQIKVLQAIPLYQSELEIAARGGLGALDAALGSVDFTDLRREKIDP